jgi:hypothetical protein
MWNTNRSVGVVKSGGAKVWYFADGWLPQKNNYGGVLESHEALMILNSGFEPANVLIDFFFEDKKPIKDIPVKVVPERVICLRLDHPDEIGGVHIAPMTQYALRIRSDVNIVVQFGRLDTAQSNLTYYINVGYCSNV